MVKRSNANTKKAGKKAEKPKRKLMRDMSQGELMEMAFVRSRAWNQPRPAPSRTRIADPVFGNLKWEGIWQGSVKDSPFGKRVPLSVVVFDDGAEPSPEQREAFAEYRKVEEKILPQIERMLFDYYEANKEELRSYPPAIRRADKRLPDLKKPGDIWRLVKLDGVVVPIQKKKGRVVMVDFKTAWDQEHGTRVMIQDGKPQRLMDTGAGY